VDEHGKGDSRLMGLWIDTEAGTPAEPPVNLLFNGQKLDCRRVHVGAYRTASFNVNFVV
jgi:hypothetical protein